MANLQWKIGDVKVTRLVESEVAMPEGGLLEQATAAAVAPYRSWLVPDFMTEANELRLSIHALVLETPSCSIVVDTCVGEHTIPGFEGLSDGAENLLDSLAANGTPRERIDYVMCTHLHFDHVGWNTMKVDGRFVPTFQNARYLFARKEWEHWSTTDQREFASTFDDAVRPVVDAGLSDLVDTDHRICEEVRLVPTHGHTPGHVSVMIESGGQRALITGDCSHHPVQWAELDWGISADTDSPAAAATRRRMRGEYGDQDVLIIGTHYAGCTAGHIVQAEGGWRFQGQR
jgi:glyoxylase-like metal-dependent hydrolase (beta-lactamase superfamily II)